MSPMQKAPLLWREMNAPLLDFNQRLRTRMLSMPAGPRRRLVAAATHTLEYLEQHVRLARLLAGAPGLVVTDGYVWGPTSRWRRQTARLPFWCVSLSGLLFPQPRLVVLCQGDPQTIWNRKPDMSPHTIRATVRIYRALLRARRIPALEIDTTSCTVEEALDTLCVALELGTAKDALQETMAVAPRRRRIMVAR
jgi:hypothetical protein